MTMKLDHDDLNRLIEKISKSDIQEFSLEGEDFKLEIKRNLFDQNQVTNNVVSNNSFDRQIIANQKSINDNVSLGWLIRSVHRWSASMMVLMLILHVFRVYLTGGFKRPRELTWVTGVVMAVITVAFGVTGYSLPWDQVGYWAVKIVSGVPAAIPVIGDFMVELLRGGESVGQSTLTRFYSLHTFVLPWSLAVFMLMHFLMIRKQGISGPL